MLSICENYSAHCNVIFNAEKTKFVTFNPSRRKSTVPVFPAVDKTVDNVRQWHHLGHVISTFRTDTGDIDERKHHFIGEVNNLLCHFRQLDSLSRCKLFNAYCTSFYGCE
jgi:hypothetical protein